MKNQVDKNFAVCINGNNKTTKSFFVIILMKKEEDEEESSTLWVYSVVYDPSWSCRNDLKFLAEATKCQF